MGAAPALFGSAPVGAGPADAYRFVVGGIPCRPEEIKDAPPEGMPLLPPRTIPDVDPDVDPDPDPDLAPPSPILCPSSSTDPGPLPLPPPSLAENMPATAELLAVRMAGIDLPGDAYLPAVEGRPGVFCWCSETAAPSLCDSRRPLASIGTNGRLVAVPERGRSAWLEAVCRVAAGVGCWNAVVIFAAWSAALVSGDICKVGMMKGSSPGRPGDRSSPSRLPTLCRPSEDLRLYIMRAMELCRFCSRSASLWLSTGSPAVTRDLSLATTHSVATLSRLLSSLLINAVISSRSLASFSCCIAWWVSLRLRTLGLPWAPPCALALGARLDP